jgi:Tfp pilus assembly protein PilF
MVETLKKVIALDPKHVDALNYLGYSYAEKGIHLEEAFSLLQRAVELRPDSGYILDSFGWVQFKMGRYAEALSYLRKAADAVGDDGTVLEHLGDASYALGLKKEALDAWERALKLDDKEQEEGFRERLEQKSGSVRKELGPY